MQDAAAATIVYYCSAKNASTSPLEAAREVDDIPLVSVSCAGLGLTHSGRWA